MHRKRVTCASPLAIGIGLNTLTTGVAVANAAPPCPPQSGDCQGGPGGPGGPGGAGGPGHQQGGPRGHSQNDGLGGTQWGTPHPDQAWRGIGDGRRDHHSFNYDDNRVDPFYSPVLNTWGFWFFGAWIPL